jgi:hypothetical protein
MLWDEFVPVKRNDRQQGKRKKINRKCAGLRDT